jgi:RNA polymerase sigma factor (sigma-70 family)
MDSGSRNYRRFRDDGDEGGLVEIIREYKDGLIFYLNSIVGNIHTAEDLAEDTFVLLGTKKPRDKGKGSFKTWLYTIGRNIAIDHVRRNRTVCEVSDAEYLSMAADEESLEESYLREERKITLYRALSNLKPEYRQVLWLMYFEELSAKETALVMKKSVHSIETLVYRARKSLKLALEKEGFMDEKL